jgi:uncharacterized repeat protein (TIGR01451 family)
MNTATTLRSRFGLALIGAVMLLAPAALAAPAQAEVQWQLTSQHGPTNFAPGGKGQYSLIARNVGDSNANEAGDMRIEDTLPAGVIATGFSPGLNGSWECSTWFPTAPGATVTCTDPFDLVTAPNFEPFGELERGMAPVLYLDVEAEPGLTVPASADNEATISSEGGAAQATAVDPTTFSSTPAGFGLHGFLADAFDSAGSPARQAGSHPYEARFDLDFNLKTESDPDAGWFVTPPDGNAKTIVTTLPRGFVGNPQATPTCTAAQVNQIAFVGSLVKCPAASQVGTLDLVAQNGNGIFTLDQPNITRDMPVYNMVPPPGAVAAFGFSFQGLPIYIIASLDPADGYAVKATITDIPEITPARSADLTLWGVPADHAHDRLRFDPNTVALNSPSTAPATPLFTLPSQCESADSTKIDLAPWREPDNFRHYQTEPVQATGCDDPRIRFQPTVTLQPTSDQADSPTGLSFDLKVPQKRETFTQQSEASKLYAGSGNDAALATPPLRDATVTLPEGMTINPASAGGLGACSAAQIGLETNDPVACPDSSKIGSVEVDTPVLPDPVQGSVYLAKQGENPSKSLLALYIVLEDAERGLLVKLPGKVEADPQTGRLTTTFAENPQFPFSELKLDLKSGPRAPLRTPATCGTYTSNAQLTSWNSSLPVVEGSDSFRITSGPSGSPCPAPGFDPKLSAGTTNPIAGAYSPFVLRLSREDGSQELAGLQATLPPGLIGRLAGIPYCPQAAIDAAKALGAPGQGALELTTPSCPAASRVGSVTAGAGAGSNPFQVQGKAYLAGPYKGAPLSLAIVTPALAGPFDLGDVVVQAALRVDPETTQITAVSDPIPHILQGIPLDIRSVDVDMDRPNFTLNPTSCDPMAIRGTATSVQGASAALSDRFQVGACKALDFKPKLALKLKGGTQRGRHPALRATLTYPRRGAYANIARAQVTLPHSEFLAQSHIRTICTRVQFAADQCPKGSIYGHARAITPLLDQPLEGPVYLRSSNHPLPDLVADLSGQIHVELVGRIDSKNGGIRTTFEAVPDAPVSKFTLTMQGGRKGLLENSRNICATTNRATVLLDAQNGKVSDSRPEAKATGCGSRHKHARAAGGRRSSNSP